MESRPQRAHIVPAFPLKNTSNGYQVASDHPSQVGVVCSDVMQFAIICLSRLIDIPVPTKDELGRGVCFSIPPTPSCRLSPNTRMADPEYATCCLCNFQLIILEKQ